MGISSDGAISTSLVAWRGTTPRVVSVCRVCEQIRPDVLAIRRLRERLDRASGISGEPLRDGHLDGHQQVARPMRGLHATTADPQHPARRRALGNLELHGGPVQGGEADLCPERGLPTLDGTTVK